MSLKVFLTGGDKDGWALDTEQRLAVKALEGTVEIVRDPSTADVVHTVWPEEILENPALEAFRPSESHATIPVVASFSNDPIALFERVPGLFDACRKWFCVAQSRNAERKLQSLGLPFVRYVPYVADLDTFKPLNASELSLASLRKDLNIPNAKYVLGSFQRDSLGSDVYSHKPQKGADVFLAIALGLRERVGENGMQVLLAGPRRHWLRRELDRLKIPYLFDGTVMDGDDYPKNILSADRISRLTQLCDAVVVGSRWEGGPRAVLETVACKRKIISTDVGISADILEPQCLFSDLSEAIDLLESDAREQRLDATIESQYKRLHQNHSIGAVASHWKSVYGDVARELRNRPKAQPGIVGARLAAAVSGSGGKAIQRTLFAVNKLKKKLSLGFSKKPSVTLWGEMVSGPYGGASQVLKAIAGELERRGYQVKNNSFDEADAHILNSAFFDVEKALTVIRGSANTPKVIHRIDGPISLYRGSDRDLDEQIFDLNKKVATATAFQCVHSWRESLKMGFEPVRPLIIRNACDPALFHPAKSKPALAPGKKVRLISSSWSTNRIKGFEAYQWLDENLDYSKYEYSFVGRSPVKFKNIKMVDALASKELGALLREQDVFITASLNDPASNSLLEAINCGLPAVYANSGGHGEFAWFAGQSFNEANEIPKILEEVTRDYESYRLCAYSLTVKDVVDQYLKVMEI